MALKPKNSQVIAKAIIFKTKTDFLVKVTFNNKFSWIPYQTLATDLSDRFESISDALGERKSSSVPLDVLLSKSPSTLISPKDNKEYLDLTGIKIDNFEIL